MTESKQNNTGQGGFSYVEVMVALVIFLIGILGSLSALAAGVLMSRGQQQQLSARHFVATAMESIMSAKETDPTRLGWKAIGNVGHNPNGAGVPQGIFVTGFQSVLANAGPDEVVGTADDAGAQQLGYSRQIVITDICDTDRPSPAPVCATPGTWPVRLRSVEVRVRYFVGSAEREEIATTILTDYAVAE